MQDHQALFLQVLGRDPFPVRADRLSFRRHGRKPWTAPANFASEKARACGRSATVENRTVVVRVCYGLSGGIGVRGHLRCDIVEGHRYAEDEPSWYAGQGQYARTTDPETSGIHERPSGAFRLQ